MDANILIRAVLGKKVRHLLKTFAPSVQFFTPDLCFADASKYLPILFPKRHRPDEDALEVFNRLTCLIHVVDGNLYSWHEQEAKLRIAVRDIDDWPIVAVALLLDCPIWTENADFGGVVSLPGRAIAFTCIFSSPIGAFGIRITVVLQK